MDQPAPGPGPQAGAAIQAALIRAVLGAAWAEADRPVGRAVLGTILAGVALDGPGAPRAGVASRTDGGPAAPGAPRVPASAHALAAWLAGAAPGETTGNSHGRSAAPMPRSASCSASGPTAPHVPIPMETPPAPPDPPDPTDTAHPGHPPLPPAPPADMPAAVALGLAAALALLPVPADARPAKGQELLLALGRGRRVAVVGHFPFVERLGGAFAALSVLELRPRPGDLPAARAADVLPAADVVAITGTALHNGTLGGLLALRRPGARVVLLGPSVPLVPALLDLGIDALAGAVIHDAAAALDGAARGLPFRRLGGVESVVLTRGNFFGLSS